MLIFSNSSAIKFLKLLISFRLLLVLPIRKKSFQASQIVWCFTGIFFLLFYWLHIFLLLLITRRECQNRKKFIAFISWVINAVNIRRILFHKYLNYCIHNFLLQIKYFMDSGVHALQYLDVIQMKDSTHKSNFYHNLKGALSSIPKVQ